MTTYIEKFRQLCSDNAIPFSIKPSEQGDDRWYVEIRYPKMTNFQAFYKKTGKFFGDSVELACQNAYDHLQGRISFRDERKHLIERLEKVGLTQSRIHNEDTQGHVIESKEAPPWIKLVLPMEGE